MPMEVTIKLLENAMRAALQEGREGEGWKDGKGRFLIDGFPRKMDQAVKFDEDVSSSRRHPGCRANPHAGVRGTDGVILHHNRRRDDEAVAEAGRNQRSGR